MNHKIHPHKISESLLREAERLCTDENLSFHAICKKLNVSYTGLKRRLDPAYRRLNNSIQAQRMRRGAYQNGRHDAGKPWQGILHSQANNHKFVPPEVLAEREAAINAPRTIYHNLMGDPLSGRSALDRRANP